MATGIYKITNPKGKVYIGQSIDLERRKIVYEKSRCKKQHRVYQSIKKYGWHNHTWEVICECKEEELNHLERYFQELYKAVENGLNLMYTSTDQKPMRLSEETKSKIGDSKKGNDYRKGKTHSESSKIKMSQSHKNVPKSEENKKNISLALKGKKLSEHTKNKIRESKRGKSTWMKGKKHSEETKKRMSEAFWQRYSKNKIS
jgi:group I intron endonuclease